MAGEEEVRTVREAVGVFNRPEDLQGAIDELLSSGFDRAELSLLAGEHAVEEKLGHRYEKVSSLADDPTVPREAYVSTEAIGGAEGGLIGGLMYVGATAAAGAVVISGGTLATAIGATMLAGGLGGFIGSILANWVGDHHSHYLQEQLDRGGLLLWVRTWDGEDEKSAVDILRKYSAMGVQVHALPIANNIKRVGFQHAAHLDLDILPHTSLPRRRLARALLLRDRWRSNTKDFIRTWRSKMISGVRDFQRDIQWSLRTEASSTYVVA